MGLKDGFTTGSAATAASIAAVVLASQGRACSSVQTPLPPFQAGDPTGWLEIPIERLGQINNNKWFAETRKDGGDDPDATHGLIIRAEVSRRADGVIHIDGGPGVGRATLPGLPIRPGEAAINPIPARQIAWGAANASSGGWEIIISVPEGEAAAKKTMNPALGIVGGISILGTQGICRPFSNDAWLASIAEAMSVAEACGAASIYLGSGRRSLRFLHELYPGGQDYSFIIAGDFAEQSLRLTKAFSAVHWGCFFGKLVKLAQGLPNTHRKAGNLDMEFLAELAGDASLAQCLTAAQALEAMRPEAILRVVALAKSQASKFAGREVAIHLFHNNGRELARV